MTGRDDATDVEQRWIHRDNPRSWAAVGLMVPMFVVVLPVVGLVRGRPVDPLASAFLTWDTYGIAYALLTFRAFRGSSSADLPRLLHQEREPGRWKRFLFAEGDGPGLAVSLAAGALVGAVLLPRLEDVVSPGDEVLLGVAVVVAVVMAWFVVILSYAVYYARLDARSRGLAFPGSDGLVFDDYLYFALSVSASFGTSDVDVVTSRMRRAVAGHAVLAFGFYAIIVALLVSALTS